MSGFFQGHFVDSVAIGHFQRLRVQDVEFMLKHCRAAEQVHKPRV